MLHLAGPLISRWRERRLSFWRLRQLIDSILTLSKLTHGSSGHFTWPSKRNFKWKILPRDQIEFIRISLFERHGRFIRVKIFWGRPPEYMYAAFWADLILRYWWVHDIGSEAYDKYRMRTCLILGHNTAAGQPRSAKQRVRPQAGHRE